MSAPALALFRHFYSIYWQFHAWQYVSYTSENRQHWNPSSLSTPWWQVAVNNWDFYFLPALNLTTTSHKNKTLFPCVWRYVSRSKDKSVPEINPSFSFVKTHSEKVWCHEWKPKCILRKMDQRQFDHTGKFLAIANRNLWPAFFTSIFLNYLVIQG